LNPGPGIWRHEPGDRVRLLGDAGLALLAFGVVASKAAANLGMAWLLGVFLFTAFRRPTFIRNSWRDPLFRLCLLWILLSSIAALVRGELSGLLETWNFALLPLVACAAYGRRDALRIIAWSFMGALLLRLALDGWQAGGIPDYSLRALGAPRNLAVLFIGSGVLVVLAFWRSDWSRGAARRAALLAVGAITLWAWQHAHSRASLIALPLALLCLVWISREAISSPTLLSWKSLAQWAAALALLAFLALPVLQDRFAADGASLAALSSGKLGAVADDSIGLRLRMWQIGWEAFLQRPWLGHGAHVTPLLASRPEWPMLGTYRHFHNGYLETVLRYGLIGFSFFIVGFVLLARGIHSAWRCDRLPTPLAGFLCAAGLLYLLLNLGESLFFFQQGWHYLVLCGGLGYGYVLRAQTGDER
jgi:O-antigen ligase